VARWLELLEVWRQVKPEDLCFFAESKEDVLLLQLYEFLNVSSFRLAPTDHLVLIDVQEVNFACLGSNYQGISLALIAQRCHVGCGVELLYRYATNCIEIPILIALKDCDLSIIGCAKDEFILSR
jgi:hypothetical protein